MTILELLGHMRMFLDYVSRSPGPRVLCHLSASSATRGLRSPTLEVRPGNGDPRLVFFSGSGRITGLLSVHSLSAEAIKSVLHQRSVFPVTAKSAGARMEAGSDLANGASTELR